VKEQSHKREMGAALRGDFERLRARRGGDTPLVAVGPVSEPAPEHERQAEAAPAVETVTGGSWLDRLRGRR
jgi:hypothetical protein